MQDAGAANALFRFLRQWKPKHRIFGGDLWDFRALRRKASDDEKRESLALDFEAGLDFIKEFSPTAFLRGNHDERLWDLALRGQGPLRDYAGQLIGRFRDTLPRSCESFPYHKRLGVYRLGHLKGVHGYYAGVTAARQHVAAYGSVLYGHTHSIDEASGPGLERRVARGVGCLCQLDMDYNRASVNSLRYAHGWAYGVVNSETGDYQVFQAEGINGRFVVAGTTSII